MAAKKQATPARDVTRTPVGYVFADENGDYPSDVYPDVNEAIADAKQFLTDATDVDVQVIFALVAMRRVTKGGFTITPITE